MNRHGTIDLYQVWETLKKLCGFSTVWADRAIFGSTEKNKQLLRVVFHVSFKVLF